MLTTKQSQEWLSAAMWCAKRGLKGEMGDPLPCNMDAAVVQEIANHTEEFAEEVRAAEYAIAMQRLRS